MKDKKVFKAENVAKRTFKEKRLTKQIRLEENLYQKVSSLAKEEKKTKSKTLGKICTVYFRNYQ